MKAIYLASPYRAPTLYAVEQNIRRVEDLILPLARAGFVPIAVHTMYRSYFDKSLPDKFWLDATMEVMERCDAVLRLPGESKGADAEVRAAREIGIPVVFHQGDIAASIAQLKEELSGNQE